MRRWGIFAVLMGLTVLVAAPGVARAQDQGWTVAGVRAEPLDGSTVSVSGRGEHRGAIEVRAHEGALAVVADLALEDYVTGLAEVPNRWPDAALEAQAIAARSYALSEMGRTVATGWRSIADICGSESCQVYAGVEKERSEGGDRWAAAVQRTKGMVLLHQGRPIRAKYSSSNGGVSVPGGQPYLPSIQDPHDAYSPLHRWVSAVPLHQVATAMGWPAVPRDAGWDGSVVAFFFTHPDTGATEEHRVPVLQLKAALNAGAPAPAGVPRPVPSSRLRSVRAEGDHLVLEGAGFGHGIGMSQWGAYGKAVNGWNAAQILHAYYGGLLPTRWDQAPQRLRVALRTGEAAAAVGGPGEFRLVALDGTVLAERATGAWEVRPVAGGVEVRPGQGGEVRAASSAAPPGSLAPLPDREPIELPPPVPLPTVASAFDRPAPIDGSGLRLPEVGAAALLLVVTAAAAVVVARSSR